MKAVDVQAFAGGFTLGVVRAGFQLAAKREQTGGFGVRMVEDNRHLLSGPWEAQACDPADWEPVQAPLVFSNPPCSGFSLVTSGSKTADGKPFNGPDSPINQCMWETIAFAAKCDPEIVIFESVQGAFRKGRGLMQALRDDLEQRTGKRYTLTHVLHNARSVGGYAQRRRYFFVASRVPFGVNVVRPLYLKTLNQVIGDLTGHLGAEPDGHWICWNPQQQRCVDLLTVLGNDAWADRQSACSVAEIAYDKGVLPDSWIRENGVPRHLGHGWQDTVRWAGEKPPPVVMGSAPYDALHPTLPRFLTPRECARILGFPDDWTLKCIVGHRDRASWIGKGITVACGEWIGCWAKLSISGFPGPLVGDTIGDREQLIDITNDWKNGVAA